MKNRSPLIILLLVFAAFAVIAILAGCASAPTAEDTGTAPGPSTGSAQNNTDQNPYHYNTAEHVGVDEYVVTLSDGRTVTCLFQNTAGALDCDWEHVSGGQFDSNSDD